MSRFHSPVTAPWFFAAAMSLASASFATTTTTADAEGPKSREQVQAELDAAVRDGSFSQMTRNRSYPPALDPAWRSHGQPPLASNLRGTGEIQFEAPAAGARSREEVQAELQRAREDGSLQRMNTNRGY
jgi:hypothetical protein